MAAVRCPSCDSHDVTGMVVKDQFEGVLFWACTVCRYRWHAWSHEAAPKLHALAVQYIDK